LEIWNAALYGPETWIIRRVDQKYLKSFEMWCWERMEKISWTIVFEMKKYYIQLRRGKYLTNNKTKEG
jgi:hypothetical protein